MARALSVGLEVANLGLDAPPTSDGWLALYDDNNLGLDGAPTSDGGLTLYGDNNLGLDAEGRLRPGLATCARTHTLPH